MSASIVRGALALLAWREGVNGLREKRIFASGEWSGERVFEGISDAPKLAKTSTTIGRSPLISTRSRRPPK